MKTTRRNFIGGAAAASLPVTATTCVAVTAIQAEAAAPAPIAENPVLLAAYARLLDAQTELREAKDALEWIGDEWRHLWPLAPEELLGAWNANWGARNDGAERDIIGRFLLRDTSVLCKRLAKKQRQETPRACFFVMTADEASEIIALWTDSAPRGKSPKAIARHFAHRERVLAKTQQHLALAREYEAETNRLRETAGVEEAMPRQSVLDGVTAAGLRESRRSSRT
ncbi:hypothetical protein ATU3C_12575 [Agrobacterium genomosp. 3 str. RTP8]|uniref:hypothetical protein n=1 Tax=Agrobacterium tomkonis TaxID=1183410 RepID=UPI001CD99AB5|nr:hypothetical protein [Agrobacterium tomkonis RTP8]